MNMLSIMLFLSLLIIPDQFKDSIFKTSEGKISFNSAAKLEIINATSVKLHGVLNTSKRTFAFAVPVNSFEGFNVALQKEHFNENYLESDKFPNATFTGKIIEDVNFSEKNFVEIRAKGILNIHGVEQERIIKVTLTIKDGAISVFSRFSILLQDHNIRVPKIVHEKIASEIIVRVQAELKNN